MYSSRFIFITGLILFCSLTGCQSSANKDQNTLKTFDLKELPPLSTVKLSDLGFADIEYIPLETTEGSTLPNIDELTFMENNRLIAGDTYFLLQHWNQILKFRSNGSFVTRIGTEGRGPTEYTVAHDIDVNPVNHEIYLISAWQRKFNVYSATGEFIRSFGIPIFAPVDFRFADDNILCYSDNLQGNIENSFILMDTSGRILKNFPNKYPFTKHKSGVAHYVKENLFYRFNNQLLKKEVYSDTICFYENLEFKPRFVIKVGEKLITPQARTELQGLEIGEKYIDPLNLFEFGDFVFYSFVYQFILGGDSKVYGFLGSKENDYETVFNLREGIINDLDGGPSIVPLTTRDDSTVIAIADVLKLKTHVASEVFKNSKPKLIQKKIELEELANSLKDTDNPVLIILKLKN